jgi:hypothetical protein
MPIQIDVAKLSSCDFESLSKIALRWLNSLELSFSLQMMPWGIPLAEFPSALPAHGNENPLLANECKGEHLWSPQFW